MLNGEFVDGRMDRCGILSSWEVSAQWTATSQAGASGAYIAAYAIHTIPTRLLRLLHHPRRQRRPTALHPGPAPGAAGRLRPQRRERHGFRPRSRRLLSNLHRLAAQTPGAADPADNPLGPGVRTHKLSQNSPSILRLKIYPAA
jgi:hypothetical protein